MEHEKKFTFIIDFFKVIRNHVAMIRIYLPAILTFCLVTCFFILFVHHVNSPSSATSRTLRTTEPSGEDIDRQTGPVPSSRHQFKSNNESSLSANFNGFQTYRDLITKSDYFANNETCEYGSLWQTALYLQGNITTAYAKDGDTRTLHVMGIPHLPYTPNYRSPCYFQEAADGKQIVLRCLPYFFLAGFPKCGTTDMYSRMEKHPLIAAPNEKEPMWFSRDRVIPKKLGIHTSFTKYATKFSKAMALTQKKARRVSVSDDDTGTVNHMGYHPVLIADFSTRILFNERSAWVPNKPMDAELVRHILPCSKFIVAMRDPVERMFSDYVYFLKKEPSYISPEHFHKRVEQSIQWWDECISRFPIQKCLFGSPKEMPPVHTGLCFDCWQSNKICPNLRIGLYYYILVEWMKLFPRECFLFLRMEDYSGNEAEVLNIKVFPFLGLPPLSEKATNQVAKMHITFPGKDEDIKSRVKVKEMLPETRRLLADFYKESNSRLAALLNDDSYLWKDT